MSVVAASNVLVTGGTALIAAETTSAMVTAEYERSVDERMKMGCPTCVARLPPPCPFSVRVCYSYLLSLQLLHRPLVHMKDSCPPQPYTDLHVSTLLAARTPPLDWSTVDQTSIKSFSLVFVVDTAKKQVSVRSRIPV